MSVAGVSATPGRKVNKNIVLEPKQSLLTQFWVSERNQMARKLCVRELNDFIGLLVQISYCEGDIDPGDWECIFGL